MSPIPPVIQSPLPPEKRPTFSAIAGLSIASLLLFILNVFATLIIEASRHPHLILGSFIFGYVTGRIIIPLAAIMCVCIYINRKSKNKAYQFLVCLFWASLGLLVLIVPEFSLAIQKLVHR